jgi:hypothetical protein
VAWNGRTVWQPFEFEGVNIIPRLLQPAQGKLLGLGVRLDFVAGAASSSLLRSAAGLKSLQGVDSVHVCVRKFDKRQWAKIRGK